MALVSERADQLSAAIKGAGERKLKGNGMDSAGMDSAGSAVVDAYLNKNAFG